MATTETVSVRKREKAESPPETEVKGRNEAQQALLDETDALLDEIEGILDMEVPVIKALTLSDLMRKGAEMNPQAFGAWVTLDGATCALSAAYTAAKAEGVV